MDESIMNEVFPNESKKTVESKIEKISSLTEQQEKDLVEFRERYLKHGLSIEPADKELAESAVKRLIPENNPEIWWFPSPYAAHKRICELLDTPNTFYHPRFGGQFEAYWIAFYQFARHIGVKWEDKDQRQLEIWDDLCRSTSLFWYTSEVCFMSDRPQELHIKYVYVNKEKRGILHKDGGAAILYRDGWAVYLLNGVRVPKWLAETPAGQIDCHKMAEIENAEIRKEFVHKVGYERILYDLGGKVLDKIEIPINNGKEDFLHTYELVELNLNTQTKWRLLKMTNPSLSTADNIIYHLEGVDPSCNTVKEALHFRKPNDFKKYPIDANGADWFQQGDVIVYPDEVVPVKPMPKILT